MSADLRNISLIFLERKSHWQTPAALSACQWDLEASQVAARMARTEAARVRAQLAGKKCRLKPLEPKVRDVRAAAQAQE
eukprot:903036-Pleurochrysis_carterae.AAC.1